ncbi:MAG TPA: ABC-2 family transporter protein [Herpetosiphonaceae bacterium]
MNYLRLFWVYLRVGVMNELQYRVNFFVQLFQSFLALATGLISLGLVFQYTDQLGGWTRPELLAVMGVHLLMAGFIKTTVQPNMERLMGDVQQGTLDYALTKPEDAQLLVSVREFRFWQLTDALMGIGVLAAALIQLDRTIGAAQALSFAAALGLGGVLVYCFWLILTAGAFWFVRVGNIIEIFQSMYQAGRWPVGVYPGWLRGSLTFLVPVAFAVTVPAEALTGRLGGSTLLGALGLAALLLIAARLIWRLGLRRYSGASA